LESMKPDIRVRELPGQGHFANLTAPKLLAETILTALDT
jgi:hypothetical protein